MSTHYSPLYEGLPPLKRRRVEEDSPLVSTCSTGTCGSSNYSMNMEELNQSFLLQLDMNNECALETPIECLCVDMLINVFSWLEFKWFVKIGVVSKRWKVKWR